MTVAQTQAANTLEFQMMLIVAHIEHVCSIKKGGVYIWKPVLRLCLVYVCVVDACWICGNSCGERGGNIIFCKYNFRHQITNPMERGTTCGNGTCGTRVHLGDQREMWTRATTKQNRDQQEKSRRRPHNRILQTRNPKNLRPYMDLRSTSPDSP